MGCASGHAGPSEGDWNAAEVLSECRPYMFSLMAFEAMFLLYAEGLEGVVVDGRRLRLRLRLGASRAGDRSLSYSVWEGEAARPGEVTPLLVRRVLWDQAADQVRRVAYSRSLGTGYEWPDADLLGLWPDLSLDSAPLGPEAAARLLPALARAEGALAAPGVPFGGVGGEGDWGGFSLEGRAAPGVLYAPSRLLRWDWPVGDPEAEGAVLRAMGAIDRELSRSAAPPASVAFEYACPPDSYLRALAGPGRLAPGAAAHARAELGAGGRPVERVCGTRVPEGAGAPEALSRLLGRAFASRLREPADVLVARERDREPAACGQVMRVVVGEPSGDVRAWCVYQGEREGAPDALVIRRLCWNRAADLRGRPQPGSPSVRARGAVVPAGRSGAICELLGRAEGLALSGPGAPDAPDGLEVEVMRRPGWGEASFGARVPRGSGAARLALEMGAALDLEIGRAGREACSVVLDHAFPPEGPARPGPHPCGDPPTGAARMRMYGSSPRDPEGGWAGLDSVELGSCRIVLDDEGDAEGLLELLGRARRPGGPGVACQRLRSGRPVRLGHGDGGEPDLIVYPDAGEGA